MVNEQLEEDAKRLADKRMRTREEIIREIIEKMYDPKKERQWREAVLEVLLDIRFLLVLQIRLLKGEEEEAWGP